MIVLVGIEKEVERNWDDQGYDFNTFIILFDWSTLCPSISVP